MTRIIILAAGKGTRMNSDLPKVLVPLNGRPIIKYLLDGVVKSGVDEKPIIVVSLDNQKIIQEALKEYQLEYVIQKEQLGTGHAVSCARSVFEKENNYPNKIVVLYGDHPFLQDISIKKLSNLQPETLAIVPVKLPDYQGWHINFYHWGRIIRKEDDGVAKIIEFRDASKDEKEIKEVNSGFMCFNTAWLFSHIDRLQNDNSQKEYYLTDMAKISFMEKKKIGTMVIEAKEAMGINSPEELVIAENLLANIK